MATSSSQPRATSSRPDAQSLTSVSYSRGGRRRTRRVRPRPRASSRGRRRRRRVERGEDGAGAQHVLHRGAQRRRRVTPALAGGDDADGAAAGERRGGACGGRGVAEAAGQHVRHAQLASHERERGAVGRRQHQAGAGLDGEQVGGRQRQLAVLAPAGQQRRRWPRAYAGGAVVGPPVGEHDGAGLERAAHRVVKRSTSTMTTTAESGASAARPSAPQSQRYAKPCCVQNSGDAGALAEFGYHCSQCMIGLERQALGGLEVGADGVGDGEQAGLRDAVGDAQQFGRFLRRRRSSGGWWSRRCPGRARGRRA